MSYNRQVCRRCGVLHYKWNGSVCLRCGRSEWWHSHTPEWDCCSETSSAGNGGPNPTDVNNVWQMPSSCSTSVEEIEIVESFSFEDANWNPNISVDVVDMSSSEVVEDFPYYRNIVGFDFEPVSPIVAPITAVASFFDTSVDPDLPVFSRSVNITDSIVSVGAPFLFPVNGPPIPDTSTSFLSVNVNRVKLTSSVPLRSRIAFIDSSASLCFRSPPGSCTSADDAAITIISRQDRYERLLNMDRSQDMSHAWLSDRGSLFNTEATLLGLDLSPILSPVTSTVPFPLTGVGRICPGYILFSRVPTVPSSDPYLGVIPDDVFVYRVIVKAVYNCSFPRDVSIAIVNSLGQWKSYSCTLPSTVEYPLAYSVVALTSGYNGMVDSFWSPSIQNNAPLYSSSGGFLYYLTFDSSSVCIIDTCIDYSIITNLSCPGPDSVCLLKPDASNGVGYAPAPSGALLATTVSFNIASYASTIFPISGSLLSPLGDTACLFDVSAKRLPLFAVSPSELFDPTTSGSKIHTYYFGPSDFANLGFSKDYDVYGIYLFFRSSRHFDETQDGPNFNIQFADHNDGVVWESSLVLSSLADDPVYYIRVPWLPGTAIVTSSVVAPLFRNVRKFKFIRVSTGDDLDNLPIDIGTIRLDILESTCPTSDPQPSPGSCNIYCHQPKADPNNNGQQDFDTIDTLVSRTCPAVQPYWKDDLPYTGILTPTTITIGGNGTSSSLTEDGTSLTNALSYCTAKDDARHAGLPTVHLDDPNGIKPNVMIIDLPIDPVSLRHFDVETFGLFIFNDPGQLTLKVTFKSNAVTDGSLDKTYWFNRFNPGVLPVWEEYYKWYFLHPTGSDAANHYPLARLVSSIEIDVITANKGFKLSLVQVIGQMSCPLDDVLHPDGPTDALKPLGGSNGCKESTAVYYSKFVSSTTSAVDLEAAFNYVFWPDRPSDVFELSTTDCTLSVLQGLGQTLSDFFWYNYKYCYGSVYKFVFNGSYDVYGFHLVIRSINQNVTVRFYQDTACTILSKEFTTNPNSYGNEAFGYYGDCVTDGKYGNPVMRSVHACILDFSACTNTASRVIGLRLFYKQGVCPVGLPPGVSKCVDCSGGPYSCKTNEGFRLAFGNDQTPNPTVGSSYENWLKQFYFNVNTPLKKLTGDKINHVTKTFPDTVASFIPDLLNYNYVNVSGSLIEIGFTQSVDVYLVKFVCFRPHWDPSLNEKVYIRYRKSLTDDRVDEIHLSVKALDHPSKMCYVYSGYLPSTSIFDPLQYALTRVTNTIVLDFLEFVDPIVFINFGMYYVDSTCPGASTSKHFPLPVPITNPLPVPGPTVTGVLWPTNTFGDKTPNVNGQGYLTQPVYMVNPCLFTIPRASDGTYSGIAHPWIPRAGDYPIFDANGFKPYYPTGSKLAVVNAIDWVKSGELVITSSGGVCSLR